MNHADPQSTTRRDARDRAERDLRSALPKHHGRQVDSVGGPVRLDGILIVEPTADGACKVFREWWHSDEKVI